CALPIFGRRPFDRVENQIHERPVDAGDMRALGVLYRLHVVGRDVFDDVDLAGGQRGVAQALVRHGVEEYAVDLGLAHGAGRLLDGDGLAAFDRREHEGARTDEIGRDRTARYDGRIAAREELGEGHARLAQPDRDGIGAFDLDRLHGFEITAQVS